jgi:hypothetical protein
MRLFTITVLSLLITFSAGCSLGRQSFLNQTAKQSLPIPEGATGSKLEIDPDFEKSSVTLNFTTTNSPEQTLQWYRDTLAARGWQLASEWSSDQPTAPPPYVSDRFLAQRHADTRQRLWIDLSNSDSYQSSGITTVRVQFESIGPLEDVERALMMVIDAPGAFFDDSLPGVCWYYFWAPFKLLL